MSDDKIFPYAGRSFLVNYGGDFVFSNTYSPDGSAVTVELLRGPKIGAPMTMSFKWEALDGGYYLLSWQEEDNATVVHCDNFKDGTTRSFYTMMDGGFYVMSGPLTSI